MKILAYFVAVAVTQVIPLPAIEAISRTSYTTQSLSQNAEDWLTIATLLVGAFGLFLGGRGVFFTVSRLRPWLAGSLTAFVWTPLLLSAAVYLYAFLVFRSWA